MTSTTASFTRPQFVTIPDDCLLELCFYLEVNELIALNNTNSQTKSILNNEQIWQKLCFTRFRISDKIHSKNLVNPNNETVNFTDNSWKQIYKHYYTLFPARYKTVLPNIIDISTRLINILQQEFPAILPTLLPGLSESELNDSERKLTEQASIAGGNQLNLPLDWLCFLRLFDGQNIESEHAEKFTGLFGGFEFYSFAVNFRLNSLKTTIEKSFLYARGLRHSTIKLIPFTRSEIGGSGLCSFFFDLEDRIVRIDPGRLREEKWHIVANNFTQFLEQHVNRLETKVLTQGREHLISRFASIDPCGSDTITRGIRIRVSVLHVPEQNHAQTGKYFFTYHVVITHEGEESLSCSLTTRHWRIRDANGHVESVDGPGVVGFYPHMYSGCPQFEYESCCPLSTPTGKMEGWFSFQMDNSDEIFDAKIDPFIFDINTNFV